MEPLPISLVLLITFLFLLRLISRLPTKPIFPPGPKGLPIIGNMMMVGELTHRGLAKLSHKYGGIFHLKMGYLHMVAISTLEMARHVLQTQDNVFSNRPATVAIRYLTYDRSDMAFAHYGPLWRQMRKICVTKVFSRRRSESWESVRDEVDKLVAAVLANNGKVVNVGDLIFNLTKNITYRAAFGRTGSQQGRRQDEFVEIMQEFSKLFGAFNVADFVPWLGWVDPQGLNTRLEKARFALDKFIDTIIDDHIQKKRKRNVDGGGDGDGDDGVNADMVDDLLAFYSEGNESDHLNSNRLTRDNIKAIIMRLASAIEWALTELMGSPEDMKRVQSELAEVVGLDRHVEESDLDKLPFLKCSLKETLRLHPPIPIFLHETVEAVKEGYRIPAKSRVMINVWAIGRDENSWEDPERFKPSRFLKEGMPDFKGSNFEFIPFGSGRRSCPGMQLGLYALDLAVAHLLHCFTWELPDGMKPSELDMSDVFGLTAPRSTRLYAMPSNDSFVHPFNGRPELKQNPFAF